MGGPTSGKYSHGTELIRRKLGGEAYALTARLITKTETARKFGKTESGNVWLDPEKDQPL